MSRICGLTVCPALSNVDLVVLFDIFNEFLFLFFCPYCLFYVPEF